MKSLCLTVVAIIKSLFFIASGIEENVFMKMDGDIVKAVPEDDVDRTSANGKASSVQFIHFRFNDEQIKKFRSNSFEIELGINHKESVSYTHLTLPTIMPV